MDCIIEEFPYRHPKGIFKGVEFYLKFVEGLETFLQVYRMVFSFETLYQHIVHICFYIPPQLMLEKLVHQSLVNGASVLQLERHDLVTVGHFASNERHIFLVMGSGGIPEKHLENSSESI